MIRIANCIPERVVLLPCLPQCAPRVARYTCDASHTWDARVLGAATNSDHNLLGSEEGLLAVLLSGLNGVGVDELALGVHILWGAVYRANTKCCWPHLIGHALLDETS